MNKAGAIVRFPELAQKNKRLVIAPLDDALIFGPQNGLEKLDVKFEELVMSGVNAVLAFPGVFERNPELSSKIIRIVNLTASTIRSSHTRKVQAVSLDRAMRLHASAVAVHINITSTYESEQIQIAGDVLDRCDRYEIPVLGIIYPRKEDVGGIDNNYDDLKSEHPEEYLDLIKHCVSVGAELGMSAIKTQYTGNADSFREVVGVACDVPLFIAGGPIVAKEQALEVAKQAIDAGAKGVSFGRNVFGRKDTSSFVAELTKLVSSY